MASGPETEKLIVTFESKIDQSRKDKKGIEDVEKGNDIKDGEGNLLAKIENLTEVINRFSPAAQGLDERILSINAQINSNQTDLFNLYTGATLAGCTTFTIPMYDALRDDVRGYTYEFTSPTYNGTTPFDESNTLITSANLGFGTYTGITQVSLGTFFGYDSTESGCAGFAASITTAENNITSLRTQRDAIRTPQNGLKESRMEYQVQRYGFSRSKKEIDDSIVVDNSVIDVLQDPELTQYFKE
tara:strand:- start:117 stop:848 length:732 start_codon:yes stop_codon:yes gene_type:complete